MIKDVLYDILWRVGIPAKKKAPVKSTLRPADILVYSWNARKHTCIDLTWVSPLHSFGKWVFIVDHAAAKVKVNNYDHDCKDNQHNFIPFAFGTFGYLDFDNVEFLRRVQIVMNKNVLTEGSTKYVFRWLGFVIQRGLAAHFVARSSWTFVTWLFLDLLKK